MALIGFKVEENEGIFSFIETISQKLNTSNLLLNPFNGFIEYLPLQKTIILSIKPIYPNFSFLGSFYIIGLIAFKGLVWSNWFIPGLVVQGLGIFWTNYFFSFFFMKGLRKAGYTGTIERVK